MSCPARLIKRVDRLYARARQFVFRGREGAVSEMVAFRATRSYAREAYNAATLAKADILAGECARARREAMQAAGWLRAAGPSGRIGPRRRSRRRG